MRSRFITLALLATLVGCATTTHPTTHPNDVGRTYVSTTTTVAPHVTSTTTTSTVGLGSTNVLPCQHEAYDDGTSDVVCYGYAGTIADTSALPYVRCYDVDEDHDGVTTLRNAGHVVDYVGGNPGTWYVDGQPAEDAQEEDDAVTLCATYPTQGE